MNFTALTQTPARREALLDDCVAILDQEVHKKKGAVAFAVKKAYQGVGKMEGGNLIRNVFDKLLDEFVEAIEPHYRAYTTSGHSGSFEAYVADHRDDVAQSLLVVTDRERDRVGSPILVMAYSSLRGTALKLVRESVPVVGAMIARHAEREASG